MVVIYLGLGSNIGDRQANLVRAVGAIRRHVTIRRLSSVIESPAQYEGNQPSFLNQVIEVETDMPPRMLLLKLKAIESALGRTVSRLFGPRSIDIDILYYGNHVVRESDLTIPHPRINERQFVLGPLREIAPHFRCPETSKTMAQLCKKLEQ